MHRWMVWWLLLLFCSSSTKPAVFAKRVESIVERLLIERKLDPKSSIVQTGVDDGGDLLKFVLIDYLCVSIS